MCVLHQMKTITLFLFQVVKRIGYFVPKMGAPASQFPWKYFQHIRHGPGRAGSAIRATQFIFSRKKKLGHPDALLRAG
jgi:hypothetical protein